MKKLFLMLAMMLPIFMYAQEYIYEEVVDADSLSKDEIYGNTMKWISSHFEDFNKVVKHQDKNAGIITFVTKEKIGSCAATEYGWMSAVVTCKFTVEIRDGRYRITIPSNTVRISTYDGRMNFEADMKREETHKALEMAADIAKNNYGYSLVWPLDEKYDSIIQSYKNQIPNRDKLKKKERILRNCVKMYQEISDGNKLLINTIVTDMKNEVGRKEDW